MRGRLLVFGAVAIALGAAVLALWPSAHRAAFSGVLSTHRADALGAKALFEVFEHLQLRPTRLVQSPLRLGHGGVLFFLNPEAPKPILPGLPAAPTFDREERAEIERFVQGGGRLIVVSARTTALHTLFGLRVDDTTKGNGARAARRRGSLSGGRAKTALATRDHPLTRRARKLAARRFDALQSSARDTAALFEHEGRPVAIAATRGAGDAIFLSALSAASNVFLGNADNLAFLYDLATTAPTPGPLRLDETRHGERKTRGLAALAGEWRLELAFGQAALAGLLLVWAGARRGRVRGIKAHAEVRHDAREQITATASLYARGRLSHHAAEQIAHALLRDAATRSHATRLRSLDDLADLLAARGNAVAAERSRALHRELCSMGDRPRPRVLLDFARRAAAVRREFGATHSPPKERRR